MKFFCLKNDINSLKSVSRDMQYFEEWTQCFEDSHWSVCHIQNNRTRIQIKRVHPMWDFNGSLQNIAFILQSIAYRDSRFSNYWYQPSLLNWIRFPKKNGEGALRRWEKWDSLDKNSQEGIFKFFWSGVPPIITIKLLFATWNFLHSKLSHTTTKPRLNWTE